MTLRRPYQAIEFWDALLGHCSPSLAQTLDTNRSLVATDDPVTLAAARGPAGFAMPTLNARQEHAVQAFLQSAPNAMTLVQGPPGTGS
jgi:hypothetical protein